MSMKVKPFEKTADGVWTGKFGRIEVEVSQRARGTYWRGPDREVVLDRPRDSYDIVLKGVMSSSAHTLAGAFQRAEVLCIEELDRDPSDARYTMTDEQGRLEAEALRASRLDAVEADRIAHANGWECAVDVLPSLKIFAMDEGLYPFDAAPAPKA